MRATSSDLEKFTASLDFLEDILFYRCLIQHGFRNSIIIIVIIIILLLLLLIIIFISSGKKVPTSTRDCQVIITGAAEAQVADLPQPRAGPPRRVPHPGGEGQQYKQQHIYIYIYICMCVCIYIYIYIYIYIS